MNVCVWFATRMDSLHLLASVSIHLQAPASLCAFSPCLTMAEWVCLHFYMCINDAERHVMA